MNLKSWDCGSSSSSMGSTININLNRVTVDIILKNKPFANISSLIHIIYYIKRFDIFSSACQPGLLMAFCKPDSIK